MTPGGGDGAPPAEASGEAESVPAPALTGSMVIEGGGDFPDDEPNLIARADRRRLELAVTVLTEIVRRMAEIAADAVEGRVVVGAIADAAARWTSWWWRTGSWRTRRPGGGRHYFFATDFRDLHGYEKGHDTCRGLLFVFIVDGNLYF